MTKEELRSLIENLLIDKGLVKEKWDCRKGFLQNWQDGFAFESNEGEEFVIVINN